MQKNKFNNTDPNTKMLIVTSNSSNESHTPLPSNSPKQSHSILSNLFEILQISPTNIYKEIKIIYRKLVEICLPRQIERD